MLAVMPDAAALLHPAVLRQCQRRLGNRAALVLEAHVLGTLPATVIGVADQRAARVGPFSAVGAASLGTSF